MLQALSKDHQNDQLTWEQLFAQYFGLNTDIYYLMLDILVKINIDIKALVADISNLKDKFTYHYIINQEAKGYYLIIKKIDAKVKIKNQEKTSIIRGLATLGYQLI